MNDDVPRLNDLLKSLSLALDLEENDKLFHAWRVAALAVSAARTLGLKDPEQVYYAALLHDIGAIGLPNHIVHTALPESFFAEAAAERFSSKEAEIIYYHPKRGAEILSTVPCLAPAGPYVAAHHQRVDRTGFPAVPANREIPKVAQVIRLADSLDFEYRKIATDHRRKMQNMVKESARKEVDDDVAEAMLATLDGHFCPRLTVYELPTFLQEISSSLPSRILPQGDQLWFMIARLFARVIDAKHAYTSGHSERVAGYSVLLASEMELPEKARQLLLVAGLLHDLGKLAVPPAVLDKPSKLTLREVELVRKHPVFTMEILNQIPGLATLSFVAGHHHERWDGLGYPDGLKANQNPLLSRILAVADAFDAMTSGRSYQNNRSFSEAVGELKKYAGTQFDPQVIDMAARILPQITSAEAEHAADYAAVFATA